MKGAPMKGKTQPVRPILIQKPLKINGYDIDVMGIVSNIVYIRMLWISDLGRAKWTVSIEIATEESINCTGTQTGFFLDLTTKRPVPLPTELRKEYERLTSQ